jgi:AcrR family transcriptional regulator
MAETIQLGPLVSSESGRAERRDAAANRELILQTAARLFAERGVEAVCMSEIAEAAGVGKGTLYRRFANKGELCLALMDSRLTLFQNEALERMRQSAADGESALAQLRQFLDDLVLFVEDNVLLLLEVQREGLIQSRQFGLPHYWQYMTVSGLLQAAVRAGEAPPDLDVPIIADMLLAPLTAPFFRFQRGVRGYAPERIRDGLFALVGGLGPTNQR